MYGPSDPSPQADLFCFHSFTELKKDISNLKTPVDIHWLFTIAEEVGLGASSVLIPDVAAMVTVDNGTTAPGQNSSEFGVTIAMADQTGPFDWHRPSRLERSPLGPVGGT